MAASRADLEGSHPFPGRGWLHESRTSPPSQPLVAPVMRDEMGGGVSGGAGRGRNARMNSKEGTGTPSTLGAGRVSPAAFHHSTVSLSCSMGYTRRLQCSGRAPSRAVPVLCTKGMYQGHEEPCCPQSLKSAGAPAANLAALSSPPSSVSPWPRGATALHAVVTGGRTLGK